MAVDSPEIGSGWRAFAGVLILIAGIFNIIDGIVAVADAKYLTDRLVFGDLRSWGWAILVIGAVQFLVGLAIFGGRGWAAFLGVLIAGLNAIGQLLFLRTYPMWSVITIAIDLLIIYGLTAYGHVRRRAS
ncbi:MAG TPA: hypothetical protein VHZ02_19775 [Acidimicrobiales bacterium]|nr:hypothetical protein [Acidimicrobiales bacterium]